MLSGARILLRRDARLNTPISPESASLTQLLIRAGRQDQQAFAELYQLTSSKLYGVCLRMLHDRSDADEVLQETWATVWRRAASFDADKASAITWLVTLARNKAIDRLRRHREQQLDEPLKLEEIVDTDPTPSANAETSQEYQRLQLCLGALEARQRTVVREAFFTGATYNQLATRCDVPLGTMKSWIRRSLLQLRTCLER